MPCAMITAETGAGGICNEATHPFFVMCGAIAAGMLIALPCNHLPVCPPLVSIGALLLVGGMVWGGVGICCPHCGEKLDWG